MRKEWLVPFAVLLANAISVLISIVAPFLLVPAQYSTFSLIWASGQFMTGVLFEWLRLAALRYSTPGSAAAEDRARVLVRSYTYLSAALLALVVLSQPFLALSTWMLYAGAILFAIGQGAFDGNQAFTRAARENVRFARNWLIRAALSLGFVIVTAWGVGSGWWTAIALGASLAAALGVGLALDRWPWTDRQAKQSAQGWAEWPMLARYGMLAAVSGIVANALPTAVRWSLVVEFGKEGAAGALLAADLSQKALAVTGLAVNVVAMQNSFSAVDSGNAERIVRANQKQVAWALAAVVPVGVLVFLLGGDVAQILMRPAYRAAFAASIGPCVLASGLICVRMFAVDPLFYAFERAGFSVIGAAVSVGVCALGLGVAHATASGRVDPLTIFWVSAAAGLVVSGTIAITVLRVKLPWSQLARIALTTGVMVLTDHLLPHLQGVTGLAVMGAVLGFVYLAVGYALDVVGLRSELLVRWLAH